VTQRHPVNKKPVPSKAVPVSSKALFWNKCRKTAEEPAKPGSYGENNH